jgi:hypothetical protein
MPALSGGMKSRWSSILGDQVEIQDRVAFFAGSPAPTGSLQAAHAALYL